MKPEVRVFTRDNPVTKKELWECFRRSANGFATVQVDEAHSVIGKNAPRYMERKGYLIQAKTRQGDTYTITPSGENWLISGIRAYVKNHPSARTEIRFHPDDRQPAQRIRRIR